MSPEEIAVIRSRLPSNTEMAMDEPHSLEFRDPYKIIWQFSTPGSEFQTAGDFAGRWLDV